MTATGLIGCGSFGKNHFRLLKELDPPFAGLFDPDRKRCESLCEEAGVPYFASPDELLKRCEAVIVAVPTVHHFDVAKQAMESGCHVLIEKPVADTVDQAETLVRTAAEMNRVLAVGHVERHNPVVSTVMGRVENPRYAVIERLSPFTARSLDIDVILDLMIHDLQIVLELAGEFPADIKALGIPVLSPKVDMATAHLTFSSGFAAHVTASRVSEVRVRKLRVFSQTAYHSVDYADKSLKGYRLRMEQGRPEIIEDTPAVPESEPLRNELEDFLTACREGRSALVDGEKAGQALKLAKTIQEEVS